ncbi:uncharacterized protein B0I36DRAFT_363304 [Microdochium trichocladiopsis]|uniref:Transmembrane protein n=1 Tax=Microdochium trichocladiopsis TaxID=1682393 RepID=A0A9P9BR97_9PEZI|nr:uncharacterized protein B0I36DRAFT_363304 [Microdochium trichocladiopsis]KAH7031640.1 hypothetical protein B0I36DRAFT_363304 [Microdochium trichocladiopsis]
MAPLVSTLARALADTVNSNTTTIIASIPVVARGSSSALYISTLLLNSHSSSSTNTDDSGSGGDENAKGDHTLEALALGALIFISLLLAVAVIGPCYNFFCEAVVSSLRSTIDWRNLWPIRLLGPKHPRLREFLSKWVFRTTAMFAVLTMPAWGPLLLILCCVVAMWPERRSQTQDSELRDPTGLPHPPPATPHGTSSTRGSDLGLGNTSSDNSNSRDQSSSIVLQPMARGEADRRDQMDEADVADELMVITVPQKPEYDPPSYRASANDRCIPQGRVRTPPPTYSNVAVSAVDWDT